MTARAADIAQKIKNNPLRILGFLGSVGNNKAWGSKVALCLVQSGIGEGTLRNWADKAPVNHRHGRKQFARRVKLSIEMWASVYPPEEEEERGEREPGPQKKGQHEPRAGLVQREVGQGGGDREVTDAFVRLVLLSPLAASIRAERVCPFCLHSEVAGACIVECVDFAAPSRELSDSALRERLEDGVLNDGWLKAAAEAHNREMHSLNGNNQPSL